MSVLYKDKTTCVSFSFFFSLHSSKLFADKIFEKKKKKQFTFAFDHSKMINVVVIVGVIAGSATVCTHNNNVEQQHKNKNDRGKKSLSIKRILSWNFQMVKLVLR